MSTHQTILDMLAKRWIDMGGGRQKLAKRKLPPHAHEPSPCVVIQALPDDVKGESISAEFLRMHHGPRFNWAHVPTVLAWHVIAPTGERYFICHWMNWQPKTVTLLCEFCDQTGRLCGTLSPDGLIDLGSRKVTFFDCQLIHEDDIDIKPQLPPSKKSVEATRDVVALANTLLRSRKPGLEELAIEEFQTDEAAHDDALQDKLQRRFVRRLKALQKELSAEYGAPEEIGTDVHDTIPLNGVFQFALWQQTTKTLFLAAAHEDRELPYLLMLGTAIIPAKAKQPSSQRS